MLCYISKFPISGNIFAGALSGCATFCFIYPLDFTRTRLSIDMGKDKPSREFKGLIDCFLKIARHDGFFGLYRGFLPSLQYIFIYRGAYYGLFDIAKSFAVDNNYGTNDNLSFGLAFMIGQVTTFVAAMCSYPLDTVRRRLMMDAGKEKTSHAYKGTIDCTRVCFYICNVLYLNVFRKSIIPKDLALFIAED
jgi:solute carrier family 25 (adenine nucleotide translocator) protein 4/5/6/31